MSSITDAPQQGTIGTNLQPKRFDIVIYQGDTFKFNMVLKSGASPVSVAGWTGRAKIMKTSGTPGETPEMTVAIGGSDGVVTVSLTKTETAALVNNTEYKYDVELTDSEGNVRTVLGGLITVTEDVSK